LAQKQFYEDFPATAFLLLLNIAFFSLELIAHSKVWGELPALSLGVGVDSEVLHRLGSLSLSDFKMGEHWRLLSATFLHGGLFHFLMNGFVLFDMGRACEPFLSSWKFLVAYVASALGGSLGSVGYSLLQGKERAPTVGASGALCGMIGLLLVYAMKEGFTERRNYLLRWIGLIVVSSFLLGSVDHAAHLGGFLVGGAFGLGVGSYVTSQAAERWRYPGYLAAVLVAVSLSFALWNYFAPA